MCSRSSPEAMPPLTRTQYVVFEKLEQQSSTKYIYPTDPVQTLATAVVALRKIDASLSDLFFSDVYLSSSHAVAGSTVRPLSSSAALAVCPRYRRQCEEE
ncbi:protein of unknown function (plasmid) [Pararobbsia alpina]